MEIVRYKGGIRKKKNDVRVKRRRKIDGRETKAKPNKGTK
jgi:hypothetical protein